MPKPRATQDDREIGKRIRAARLARDLSQTTLGEAAGCTFQQIQKYENGSNRIAGGRLVAVARALDVSVATLIGEGDGSVDLTFLGSFDRHSLRAAALVMAHPAEMRPALLRTFVAVAEAVAVCSAPVAFVLGEAAE